MHERVVLIGAGSVSFTRGLVADLLDAWPKGELALVDTDSAALHVATNLARKMIAARGSGWKLEASEDRTKVLKGATAVICTVGVGGRRAWEQDVFVPRKYGIYQPVGDSVGPGGSSRALRMIPAMVNIAEDILELAPDALFFNYGNPMAPVCRAIRKATGAPVIGLCHGVNHTAHYLAGALGVSPSRCTYNAVGMNHLTWFTDVRVDGADAMPRLREIAARRIAEGTVNPAAVTEVSPFSWHLFLLFGAFPAVLDRHVVEFFPQFFRDGSYYGLRLGVDAFSFEETIAAGDCGFAAMEKDASSPDPLPAQYHSRGNGEHEQVVSIISSMREDSRSVFSANLPNVGQVADLPASAIIESPAVATARTLLPVVQPRLGPGILGTLATRLLWVETIVDAALERKRDLFIQALVLDGYVASLGDAAAMAGEFLQVHAPYVGNFD
ncbi:MAG TPA: hypothetical protein PLE60_12360 [Candidatus Latescibacteria bacterium]|nr:hypothetical protein [Candidatus Latescibacterota bacterium]